MLSDCISIKKNLEETFDIPFEVQKTLVSGEPCFLLAPDDPGKELFSVKVIFRNQIRLTMDFIPHKYSANYIWNMGQQPLDKRKLFSKYAETVKCKGAKCTVKVNDTLLDVQDIESWPQDWRSFAARVTKMPITDEENLIYSDAVMEWGSIMMGMVLSLAEIVPVDIEECQTGYCEGDLKRVESNRYERNPLNRKLCLAAKGYNCAICGMNFEDIYGEIGRKFIHVHHIRPVSRIGANYVIDPIKDLIPVCPNCHAVLHKNDPPFMPDQVRSMINRQRCRSVTYINESEVLMAAEEMKHDEGW